MTRPNPRFPCDCAQNSKRDSKRPRRVLLEVCLKFRVLLRLTNHFSDCSNSTNGSLPDCEDCYRVLSVTTTSASQSNLMNRWTSYENPLYSSSPVVFNLCVCPK